MKPVLYLFSLWLLVLSGLPCPDAGCCHAEKSHTTQEPTPFSSDEHGHKTPCSPFCSCAVCAGFVVPPVFWHNRPVELPSGVVAQKRFTYQSTASSDVATAIWQPPKL